MKKVNVGNKFYSTRSAIEHPAICSKTLEEAIKKAESKLTNTGHESIFIVKIIKVVQRHNPVIQYDLFDVK